MADEPEVKRRSRTAAEYGPTAERVAKNVLRLRKRAGLTTRELAAKIRAAGRPFTPSAVSRIETCKRQVTVDDLAALSTVFGVSPAVLLLPPEVSSHPTIRSVDAVLDEVAYLVAAAREGSGSGVSVERAHLALDRALAEVNYMAAGGRS